MELDEFLGQLISAAPYVRERSRQLFDDALPTIPIPFFGDISNAKVISIGLNPSDGELRHRGWPNALDVPTLKEKLVQYFRNRETPPHPWFQRWSQGLAELGIEYRTGAAAHVDLCPWATRPASAQPNQELFTRLVSESVGSFLRCLALASNAKLLLMAGAVNKKHYLNEFLIEHHGKFDFELTPRVRRVGAAFVGNQRLRYRGSIYPVFFCSVSPSSRTGHLLPERIREHKTQLLKVLGTA